MVEPSIKNLYYITHIDNIPSILKHGILSDHQILDKDIIFTPIYDKDIVNYRQKKLISDNQNSMKWFLLFVTKRKWRDNSRLEEIEQGLDWIRKNAVQQGIKSLAIPALGCGLGNLEWSEIGPLMCRYLYEIGIHVAIYLPRENPVDDRYLTAEYLLRN